METLIIHAEREKVNALKDFLRAFGVDFEEKTVGYDAEFVQKIKESENDFKEGRYKKIATADLWK